MGKHYTKVSITLAIVVIRYINGPNFMVKAIADHRKVHTPTFLGYIMLFTLPYMLPILVVVC